MAKRKAEVPEFQNERHILHGTSLERHILVESWLHPEMTKAFAESSHKFHDRLQFLRQKLEGKFERYSDDGGLTSRHRWNPPEYFNVCHYRSQLRLTHEAWHVARRVNADLQAFDGETILALVLLFEQMRSEEIQNSGAVAPAELYARFFRFEHEADRFKLLLSLKAAPPELCADPLKRDHKRRCRERDETFHRWHKREGLTPAQIRDRWNKENPDFLVSIENASNGRGTVKAALHREKLRREKLRREKSRKTPGTT